MSLQRKTNEIRSSICGGFDTDLFADISKTPTPSQEINGTECETSTYPVFHAQGTENNIFRQLAEWQNIYAAIEK
jgi:hypothetical protein